MCFWIGKEYCMKRLFSIFVVATIFASCSPISQLEPTNLPESTATFLPTKTQLPSPTFTPTLIPTPTLSPDPNMYQFDDNVSEEDRTLIKNAVQIARYYLLNNFGSDLAHGVKFIVTNDTSKLNSYGDGVGAFIEPKNQEVYIELNVAGTVWKSERPKYQNPAIALVVHELTHYWQYEHGCVYINYPPYQPTTFMIEGHAGYVGYMAAGAGNPKEFERELSDDSALSFWQANTWKESEWFLDTNVDRVIVKHLMDSYGMMAFTQFCDAIGSGANPNDAFQLTFGISVQDFRSYIKQEILGQLADCTVATCGAGVDNFSDKYSLGHLLDPSRTTPNLIVKFVDQNNSPLALPVEMAKQGTDNTGEYATNITVAGIFSESLIPGRYIFSFCEPGTNFNVTGRCLVNEYGTDWIDVYGDKTTELTLQIPPPIVVSNLAMPNLVVTITDKDGNPMPDLGLQICNYDTLVMVCSFGHDTNRFYTDNEGVFHDSLRSGKYFIRLNMYSGFHGKYEFFPFYEIRDINIIENNVTTISYQFPTPNLVVKFTDVNGTAVPKHEFVLCRIVNGMGDCNTLFNEQDGWAVTNYQGIFEAQVEPGEYYILTCLVGCPGYPFDFKFENIVVSESQVMTYELSLSKNP